MTLYEINQQIADIIENGFTVDEETGEVLCDLSALDMLFEQKETKIENTLLYIKNLTAEATAIRAEEKALAERRKSLEKRADRLTAYIERILKGELFSTSKVEVKFTKSKKLALDDMFMDWARIYRDDLLRMKEPEPDKKAITALIKSGEEVPYARLEDCVNMKIC